MPEERTVLQAPPWPETLKTHDGRHFTQDEAGLIYVPPQYVAELMGPRHNCRPYTPPTAAVAAPAVADTAVLAAASTE